MGWNKQYDGMKPYKQGYCTRPNGVKMLHSAWYNIIDETDTKYLIQFKSGGAKWYRKDRFGSVRDIPKPAFGKLIIAKQPDWLQSQVEETKSNVNRLF